MGIRKITFDNGDIVLAKDQAILYDLLLKQQTKTLLPNDETIYQNSTGFLIQNESEKLTYSYKNIVYGLEFTFNPQLYLIICGRIIKLEKDTKYLFDWNDIENNENYYIAVRVDLNKEAKIINRELKEFDNPVEIKLINTKEKLIQDNLNQKQNDGIYEFPLISFIKKYNLDNSWEIKTKDESTYLLPLLMEWSHNPSKLLTITQKIKEEKELLQEKQSQLKDIKNYLTNLEYIKTQELNELETCIKNSSVYQLEHFTRVYVQEKPFSIVESKYYMRWYIIIWRGNINDNWRIVKFKHNEFKKDKIIDKYNEYKLELKEEADYPFNSTLYVKYSSSRVPVDWESNNGTYFKAVYRWYDLENPNIKGKTAYFFDRIK